MNQDHDGPFCWPRENWAVFHETYEIYSPYRLAVNWLWLKQDFLNGGAANRVTFDDESRLALVLKRYFMCIDSVRFLVRDGQQCYLSEATFRPRRNAHASAHARLAGQDTSRRRRTTSTSTSSLLSSQEHTFEDVTAVGVYAAKDRFIPSYFGYKWYAFEADAVVHRRKRPSETIAMVKVRRQARRLLHQQDRSSLRAVEERVPTGAEQRFRAAQPGFRVREGRRLRVDGFRQRVRTASRNR